MRTKNNLFTNESASNFHSYRCVSFFKQNFIVHNSKHDTQLTWIPFKRKIKFNRKLRALFAFTYDTFSLQELHFRTLCCAILCPQTIIRSVKCRWWHASEICFVIESPENWLCCEHNCQQLKVEWNWESENATACEPGFQLTRRKEKLCLQSRVKSSLDKVALMTSWLSTSCCHATHVIKELNKLEAYLIFVYLFDMNHKRDTMIGADSIAALKRGHSYPGEHTMSQRFSLFPPPFCCL